MRFKSNPPSILNSKGILFQYMPPVEILIVTRFHWNTPYVRTTVLWLLTPYLLLALSTSLHRLLHPPINVYFIGRQSLCPYLLKYYAGIKTLRFCTITCIKTCSNLISFNDVISDKRKTGIPRGNSVGWLRNMSPSLHHKRLYSLDVLDYSSILLGVFKATVFAVHRRSHDCLYNCFFKRCFLGKY